MSKLKVLHEDNHILAVVKPPGIPSQGDSSGDKDMLTLLKSYIKDKYSKPGNVYLGLVHRLDRPVGGAMVFARTSKAASRLAEDMTTHRFEKYYYCICEGQPEDETGTLVHYLLKNQKTNTTKTVRKGTPKSKKAMLKYEVLETNGELSLCRIQLFTGRSHQIRVQFQDIGCPLWGDQRYNENAKKGQWIALLSREISFKHPTTKERIQVYADPPKQFPWSIFQSI